MSALLAAALAAATPSVPQAPVAPTCAAQTVAVDGLPLWVDLQGQGETTVVFESGNGNDSTVWDALEPQVRALGVRTFRYDRRGYGRSAHFAGETYTVEMDLSTLQGALTACGITGPIVAVAHSYGGGLAVMTARRDRRIKGLVLVDAVVPGVSTPKIVRETLAEVRPQYAEVRKEAPDLARTVIPIMEAWGQTMDRVNATPVSRTLPIIDIVADGGGGGKKPEMTAHWRKAHRRFVAAAPASRTFVDAVGSGHKVMKDKPELIVEAIRQMLGRVQAAR